jgi:transposase
MVISPALLQHELLQQDLPHMGADQLRVAVNQLLQNIATKDNALSQQAQELTFKQATIDKLTHENAYLKRLKFAAQSERFSAERHIRGKWACAQCETLSQAPVDAHVIDKGIPSTGLLAQVLVAKFADHLPLYRQEAIFSRAGFAIPRSTLGSWVGSCGVQLQPLVDALKAEILSHSVVHADETPVQMLKPGSGKTHRAYLWAYAAGAFEETKAVVYDFCESRAGQNAAVFLGEWRGSLVCDDFSGYKQSRVQIRSATL